MPYGLSRSQPA